MKTVQKKYGNACWLSAEVDGCTGLL